MIEMLFAIFRRSIDLPLKVLGLKYKSRKAEGETRADEARSDAQIPPESKASDIVGTSFSTPQLKGRLALLGFPGAGNVLAATIASHLSEMYAVADDVASTQQDQQTEKVLADFSSRYNLLTRVLADAVPKHWDANTYIQHGELNLANFHVDIDNTTSVALTRLPLPTHLNSKIHAAHQVADMRASSFFDSRGYTVAVTIRHPLSSRPTIQTGPPMKIGTRSPENCSTVPISSSARRGYWLISIAIRLEQANIEMCN